MTFPVNSRRDFLKTLTTTALVAPASLSAFADISAGGSKGIQNDTPGSDINKDQPFIIQDGPASPLFTPLPIGGNMERASINRTHVSGIMAESVKFAPSANSVCWGIPFNISGKIIFLKDKPFSIKINPLSAKWIVFMHTSDQINQKRTPDGFFQKPFRGMGMLNDEIARYIVIYEDGKELILPIRQRYHIGMFQQSWGENSIESVASHKPAPVSIRAPMENSKWGWVQTRVSSEDRSDWINWLWAWENPEAGKKIAGLRFEPLDKSPVVISSITAGSVITNPLCWNSRQKARLTLPKKTRLDPLQEKDGSLTEIRLDMGQIISVVPLSLLSGEGVGTDLWQQSSCQVGK